MHSLFKFGILLIFVIAIVEPNINSHVKRAEQHAAHLRDKHQALNKAVRERRQVPSDDCMRDLQKLDEHIYSEECQELFFGGSSFFNGLDDDYIQSFCGRYNCSGWLPPLITDADKDCDFGMDAVVTLLKLSCDKNGRDYCLYDWQKVGDIFDGVNDTLSQNYGRCLNRNVTFNPCPDECKSTLKYLNDELGCCYADLLEDQNTAEYMIGTDVFKDCDMSVPRTCT